MSGIIGWMYRGQLRGKRCQLRGKQSHLRGKHERLYVIHKYETGQREPTERGRELLVRVVGMER